jgi:hypothetical protein
MRRKLLRTILFIVGGLAAIVLILALSISPIVKSYVQSHSKELIGRKLVIGDLHINVFTGALEVDSIRLYEANDREIFASVDTFSMNLTLTKLIHHTIEISDMKIVGPSVVILQKGHTFNFDDLIARLRSDTSKSSFQSVVLNNILLREGKISYADEQFGRTVIASIGTVVTNRDTLYPPVYRYSFGDIHLSNIGLNIVLRPTANSDTTSVRSVGQPSPSKPVASQTMAVRIKKFLIDDSRCTFTDSTLVSPFQLPLSGINILTTNFDLSRENEFSVKATFPEGGKLDFNWRGTAADSSTQQISLNLQNLSLSLFSPYCLQYTAYGITEGNLNFLSKNVIRQDNIESTNLIDTYKMNVGDKHGDLKPKVNLPLPLALYLLKDKDDKISFDVPVKGNLKDPQFSYTGIIIKTLVNLMVKVAVSPIRFLARALGMNPNKMESIEIEPLQTDFTAQQYRQISDLASIAKKKPEMTLTLTQFVNMKEEIPAYALYKTKAAFLAARFREEKRGTPSYEDVTSLDENDTTFETYLDSLVKSKGVLVEGASLWEKVNSLYVADSLQAELRSTLEKRNEFLRKYMITSYQIPPKKLLVKMAEKSALDSYTDKALYKIQMTLPEGAAAGTSHSPG